MTLLSIPANPVPEGAIAGTIGTPAMANLTATISGVDYYRRFARIGL